jgi:hypothetical protein
VQETQFALEEHLPGKSTSKKDYKNSLRMGNSRYLMEVVPDGTFPGDSTEKNIMRAIYTHMKMHENEVGGAVTLEGHKARHKGGQPANEFRSSVRGQGYDVHLGFHRNLSHTKAGTLRPLRDIMVISRADPQRRRARNVSELKRLEQRDLRLNQVREVLERGCRASSHLFKPGSLAEPSQTTCLTEGARGSQDV